MMDGFYLKRAIAMHIRNRRHCRKSELYDILPPKGRFVVLAATRSPPTPKHADKIFNVLTKRQTRQHANPSWVQT